MRKTVTEMFPIVEQYHTRNISRIAFCKKHKLAYGVLDYWVQKHRKANAPILNKPQFAEIKIEDSVIDSSAPQTILIRTSSGTEIVIPL